MQAAAPTLPLVRSVGGFVEHAVDAGFFERRDVHFRIAAEGAAADAVGSQLAAAVTHKHEFHLLLEPGHVRNVRHRDAATTEDADVRERVQMRQGDRPRLHATHREPGHGAMRLVRYRSEVCVDEWNEVVDQHLFEGAEIEAAKTCPPAWTRGS